MNLKFLTTLHLICVSLFAHCQAEKKHLHNSIDDIRNSKELVKFITPILEKAYMKSYVVDTGLDVKNTLFRKLTSKVTLLPWQKTDVDGDGYTDLFVMLKYTQTKIDSGGRVLALIKDTGKNNPYLEGEYGYELDPTVPVYTVIQNKPAIFFYHFDRNILKKTEDTVFFELPEERGVYMAGAFIEYNSHHVTYDIDSMSYQTSACYGSCPIFKISIDKKRNGFYEAIRFNKDNAGQKLSGVFTAKIDDNHFRAIEELLNYINFPALKDKYGYDGEEPSDLQTATFTVTYNNGKKKIIDDYGLEGTAGLSRLYKMLTALRLNQNWH